MGNKRKKGKVLSLIVTAVMLLSTLGGVTTSTIQVKAAASVSNPRTAKDGTVTWDKVQFGNYYQSNGNNKEPIEWRVLSVNGNDAFVVADKALDCKPYNEQGTEGTDSAGNKYTDYSCTWETCTLRDWLNGTDAYASDKTAFIKAAFTDNERAAIIETTVVNGKNSSYGTEGGNNTKDKIYLLSIEEASNTSYGFNGTFSWRTTGKKTPIKSRIAHATDYAISRGVYVDETSGSSCWWWLRSPGEQADYAANVRYGGWGDDGGYNVRSNDYAVRPALHVNLSSPYVKYSGTISSNGVAVTTPAEVSITSAKNSKKKSIVIKWKKVKGAKGYEISYALNNKFTKSKKTKTVTSGSKVSFTASKLKKGKTYYVRVRAYNKGTDGSKVNGKWSAVKKVKIKK